MRPESRTISLAGGIEHWAKTSPAKVALHFHGWSISYARFWSQVDFTTKRLEIEKGERVAYLGYNSPEMLVLLFALARLGGILVPLNWRLTAAEHKGILADCSPRWLFCDEDFRKHADGLGVPIGKTGEERKPELGGRDDDDLLIVYTSGTTGKPKGAVLRQSALLCNARNAVDANDLTPDDHVLSVLPHFHAGGLNNQTVPALLSGATVTLHRRFEPGAWLADVAAQKPTLSLLVPATMQAVINHPDWASTDLSSLRMIHAGSMVVPDSLIRAFHARGVPVGQIYGSTETSPIAVVLRREDAERKLGSAGKPAPHSEVKVENGEVLVKGLNVMRGYWNDAAATAAALTAEGWFRTGDLARIDDEGYYWILGRSKDVIISGGENIYPAELENVLADCPAIAEAAVVGVQDLKWGEQVVACVVLKEESVLEEKQVKALFDGRLARYKHPKRVVFLDSLPKNALGKVVKAELKTSLSHL